MYFSARQLEQMLRERREIVLPPEARLTPAAQDLVRLRRLEVRFDANALKSTPSAVVSGPAQPPFLWWCGAKSGTCKAAVAMCEREVNLRPAAILDDASRVLSAVRAVDTAVKAGEASGGLLVAEHAGLATVLCNRSPRLRAVVGTSLAGVDEAIRQIAANVLILEPSSQPLMALKNMIVRFVRAPRNLDANLEAELVRLGGAA